MHRSLRSRAAALSAFLALGAPAAALAQISTAPPTPGGANGQLQFNNAGVLGGFVLAGDCSLSEPNIVCLKTNGTPFAPSATTDTTNASNITSGALAAARLAAGAAAANLGFTPPSILGTPTAGDCVEWSTASQIEDAGAACGSGTATSPGGSSGQLQYNNGGSFGGVANFTLTAPAAATTLTIASGSTLATSGAYAVTLAFTGATTATLPAGTYTLASLGAVQTFTGISTFSSIKLNGASGVFSSNNQIVISGTAPTITSGLGTSPAVTDNSGTAAFLLTAGAAGTPAVATVLGLPAASHGWRCTADDLTTTSEVAHQTGAPSTTAVTLTWYAITTGVATAPSSSDQIAVSCMGF